MEPKIIACKLTSLELQKYKTEVITLFKDNILKREELSKGYRYTFSGSDAILDQLIIFIKAERQCCDFLSFNLSIKDDQSSIVLKITGPGGTREFINKEMEF
ncbi:MAG: hypothetical protein KGM16_07005 [Bacteroidota bacterium]|nr:hypothetical protein [Bacteroidota bacterium]